MDIKAPKFSLSLVRNFLLSTFIPLACITIIIAGIYKANYTKDISQLVNTTLGTISANLNTYLKELDQASLMPYYNEDFFSIIAEIKSKGEPPNTLDKIHLENTIGNLLSFSRYTREDIVGAIIAYDKYCLFNTTNLIDYSIDSNYNFSKTDWYQKAIAEKGSAIFIPPHTIDYYTPNSNRFSNPEVISVVRAIVNIRTREPLCVIKIDTNMSSFNNMFKEISYHVPSVIIITDSDNNLIYSNNDIDSSAIQRLSTEESAIYYNNKEYYTYCREEENYSWNIFVLLDRKSIDSNTNYIYLIAVLFYSIGLAFAAILYILRNRKIVKTINTINQMVVEIQNGNFHSDYKFDKNNELQILINSIIYITSLLEEKIEKEYQLTIQQKNLQFRALQAQVNPHFLFNTLNGFIALNQIGKNEELEHSLYSLTNMLRYTLSEEFDSTVEQEVQFLNGYCSLQKLRFQKKLNYSINCDTGTADYKIPRLILQPLVENAIIHGIEPLQRPCFLSVDIIKYKKDEIIINIEDDGIGFDPESVTNHTGISNVENRIMLINPDNKFNIESSPNAGTIITIVLKAE
jgi:two-component system sensor histidine kinase YesM